MLSKVLVIRYLSTDQLTGPETLNELRQLTLPAGGRQPGLAGGVGEQVNLESKVQYSTERMS